MIELRRARLPQLVLFSDMEQDADTSPYILPTTLDEHRRAFERDDIIYLSINAHDQAGGFIILALDADPRSVELRRIVVADKGRGTGTGALAALEDYCRQRLRRERIWLDVFEFNRRGRRVYSGLGYRQFDQREFEAKALLFFDKELATD